MYASLMKEKIKFLGKKGCNGLDIIIIKLFI